MAQENSKQAIMDAALCLFMEKGYNGTGVAEIVEKANVTKPTMYYFFNSKEGLFNAILEKYYNQLLEQLKSATVYNPNPQEYFQDVFPVLVRTAEAVFSFAKENKNFYLLVLSMSYANPDAEASAAIKKFQLQEHEIITAMFKKMSEYHGNLKNKEKWFAISFTAVIQSYIAFWHHGGGQLNLQMTESLVKQFMHGIFA